MKMGLRDQIESRVLTFSYHADEQGAYKICTDEIIKTITEWLDERIGQLRFFEESVDNNKEYRFNSKRSDKKMARIALQNKRLAFEEVKKCLG